MKVLTLAAYAFAIWNLWKWLDVLKEAAFFDFLSRRLQTKRKNFTHSDHHPRVSVIVPACNEENDIVETLESLQSQTYPNFEVIAVNDRSTDNTGRLIEEFCKDKANFHAIEVRELPGGWLGKNHAMHIGSKKASGDYLLFTDADIRFASKTLEDAIPMSLANDLDLLVMAPTFHSKDLLLSVMQCFFSLLVLTLVRPSGFGKSEKSYIGAGAFNLIRREFYNQFKGHTPLRLEVLDDIMLGKLVAKHNGSLALLDGRDYVSVAWYESWREMIKGLQKNFFAGLRFSWLEVLRITVNTLGLNLLPYLFLFVFTGGPFYVLLSSVVLLHFIFGFAAVKMSYSPFLSVLVPVGAVLVWFAQIRSAWVTTRNKGITWRGTFYSIKQLKQHML